METKNTAFALMKMMEKVREIHPRMEVQTLYAFCMIAREPNLSYQDIQKALGVTTSSVGRNVDQLGKGNKRSKGMGLVIAYPDPEDRRTQRCKLTKKGEAWWGELSDIAEDALSRVGLVEPEERRSA